VKHHLLLIFCSGWKTWGVVPEGQVDVRPPVQVFSFDVDTFDLGIARLEAAPGEPVRIYNPARTVVDLMRLRHQIGEPIALTVLRRYLRGRRAEPATLLEYARALNVFGPVRAAVDVASAG
jgi:hypothetical protein